MRMRFLLPEASDEQVQIGLGILFATVGITQFVTQIFLIRRFLPRLGEIGMIITAVGLMSHRPFADVCRQQSLSRRAGNRLSSNGLGLHRPVNQFTRPQQQPMSL